MPNQHNAEERLVPLADVQHLALTFASPLPSVAVPIEEALGLVTAEDVVSTEDVPAFANSAMDGYAVRAEDTAGTPSDLLVVGLMAAGHDPAGLHLGPGQAIQIMTGAAIPGGATGIAIVERTEPSQSPGRVRILDEVTGGAHIRPAGSDIAAGTVVIPSGQVITPAHIGVLASIGAVAVQVHRRPRVGVMSTGDELVDAVGAPGASGPLRTGQIRDSNRKALLAVLRRDGFQGVDLGIVPDAAQTIRTVVATAVTSCDAVLSTGGVSMGEFDYVKLVLAEMADESADNLTYEIKVAMRPAKPLVLAALASPVGSTVPVFGLPGNPVSCLVSYQMVALPVLRVLAGGPPGPPATIKAIAGEDLLRRPDGKIHLVRVLARFNDDGRLVVTSAGSQGSHQLSALAAANALAVVPDGEGVVRGDSIDVIVFGPAATPGPLDNARPS